MNNADLIVATLKANGIRHGFGIERQRAAADGGDAQGRVEFVLTAHEGSAGFAADVTGRMTSAPGFASPRWGLAPPTSRPAWARPSSIARR